MNIFWLSKNIKRCARYHCNSHVVKMILEYAQLLFSAHWILLSDFDGIEPYKLTHANHPCAVWVRACSSNYLKLSSLSLALCREYTHRYGKVHKTQVQLEWLATHVPVNIPSGDVTVPPICTQSKGQFDADSGFENVIHAYRYAYINEKASLLKYKLRDIPEWIRTDHEQSCPAQRH